MTPFSGPIGIENNGESQSPVAQAIRVSFNLLDEMSYHQLLCFPAHHVFFPTKGAKLK
jgi:hypothetical protein